MIASLPLFVCLLSIDEVENCYSTADGFVSHVIECSAMVAVYSGQFYIDGGRYTVTFENGGFPSERWYVLGDGSSDGFEDCATLIP